MASSDASAKPLRPGRLWTTRSHSSYSADAPLAQAAIAKDLEEEPDDDPENPIDENSADESDSDGSTIRPGAVGNSMDVSMIGSYRRPGITAAGSRATVATTGGQASQRHPTKQERQEARREERSLLRDNNIIPPKHPQKGHTIRQRLSRHFASVIPGGDRKVIGTDERAPDSFPHSDGGFSESTPLIGDPELPYGGQDVPAIIDKKWEEAVMSGQIQTTWQRETKVLFRYSAPLILTFFLQYSLTIASIFTVGHLGTVELAAVSLASMTANITGYAIYHGLATSLDTLCAQAYGSGRKKLVGLQTQRMVCSPLPNAEAIS